MMQRLASRHSGPSASCVALIVLWSTAAESASPNPSGSFLKKGESVQIFAPTEIVFASPESGPAWSLEEESLSGVLRVADFDGWNRNRPADIWNVHRVFVDLEVKFEIHDSYMSGARLMFAADRANHRRRTISLEPESFGTLIRSQSREVKKPTATQLDRVQAVRKAGDWNEVVVRKSGTSLVLKLNGEDVARHELPAGVYGGVGF